MKLRPNNFCTKVIYLDRFSENSCFTIFQSRKIRNFPFDPRFFFLLHRAKKSVNILTRRPSSLNGFLKIPGQTPFLPFLDKPD